MKMISRMWLRTRLCAINLIEDCKGIAATEFAVIVPIMLVMFFGTVEFSSGVAVDRKVTIVARTVSDLTSQAPPATPAQTYSTVNDTYLQNVFTASISILQPYTAVPTQATVSQVYVDTNNIATVQWSKAATIGAGATQAGLTTSGHNPGDVITLPSTLLVPKTYLIFSEVRYLYTPTVGYVMGKAGVTLSDVSYTRPRQVVCVVYNNVPILINSNTTCPTP